jgi:hypothetical protein
MLKPFGKWNFFLGKKTIVNDTQTAAKPQNYQVDPEYILQKLNIFIEKEFMALPRQERQRLLDTTEDGIAYQGIIAKLAAYKKALHKADEH